jgi:Multidrug resistance efflux pump
MMRVLFSLMTLGLVVVACLWLHGQSRPLARPVKPISQNDKPQTIFAPGVVEGASEQVALRLELAGKIEEVFVNEGDFVEPATLLVKLDDATYRQKIDLLQAELSIVQAELQRLKNGAHQQERLEAAAILDARQARLTHADGELSRAKRLLESRAIGDQEVARWVGEVTTLQAEVHAAKAHHDLLESPAREDEVKSIEAKISAAEARLELAKTELSRTLLHAPSAGQVLEVNHEPGELIDPNDPKPTIVIADTRRLRVRAFVEERDAIEVRTGMTARITADGAPGQVFTGHVAEVLPRMSFKQVWTDRADERFNTKSREVLIDLDERARGVSALDGVSPVADVELVFGLVVEVAIDPVVPVPPIQHASLER